MNTTAPLPGPAAHAQPPGYPAGPVAPVQNYLVPAILTTLFCCLPFGIVSIVYASQVSGKMRAGDMVGAQISSQKAKTWAMVSFICGLIGVLLQILLVAAGEM